MDDYYIGEICVFAGNFAPRGWVFCAGGLLSIGEYQALYSLIGTYYGGDGRVSFGVPDLRQRVTAHRKTDDPYFYFPRYGGTPSKLVTNTHMPAHTHDVQVMEEFASASAPDPTMMLANGYRNSGPPVQRNKKMYALRDPSLQAWLNPEAVSDGGGGGVVELDNHQPYLVCNYIIATDDVPDAVYPNRS